MQKGDEQKGRRGKTEEDARFRKRRGEEEDRNKSHKKKKRKLGPGKAGRASRFLNSSLEEAVVSNGMKIQIRSRLEVKAREVIKELADGLVDEV